MYVYGNRLNQTLENTYQGNRDGASLCPPLFSPAAPQSCKDASAALTCAAPAVKDGSGTCAGKTCAASDFGDDSKACCAKKQSCKDASLIVKNPMAED